ncbi:hypothetical protein [Sedimentibacter sp.]|uniref:hypothetical protein n=1 Tax=Sedimentibacter sp. TaxID=1960295 RepID=UPI00289E7A96|nr:hypothetical protein [Sedimentibacter sp.]
MKKTIIFVLALILVGATAVTIYAANAYPKMTGRCLVTTNEIYMIVDNNGSPIIMNNQSDNKSIFEGLKSGDKIKITFDGIDLSYPGRTSVYRCKLISEGSFSDIPKATLSELQNMGWQFEGEQ